MSVCCHTKQAQSRSWQRKAFPSHQVCQCEWQRCWLEHMLRCCLYSKLPHPIYTCIFCIAVHLQELNLFVVKKSSLKMQRNAVNAYIKSNCSFAFKNRRIFLSVYVNTYLDYITIVFVRFIFAVFDFIGALTDWNTFTIKISKLCFITLLKK